MTQSDNPPSDTGDPVPSFLCEWPFRGAFSSPTWRLVLVLVMGALLAPGKRTVLPARDGRCARHSRPTIRFSIAPAGTRAIWRAGLCFCWWRGLPLVIGLDDTIERRARINARGIYPVRSSHFVKTSGLRWLHAACPAALVASRLCPF